MGDAKDCDRNFGLLIKAATDDFYDTFMIVNSLEGNARRPNVVTYVFVIFGENKFILHFRYAAIRQLVTTYVPTAGKRFWNLSLDT